MRDDNLTKLRTLLEAYGKRATEEAPSKTAARSDGQRRLCGEKLRTLVLPMLDIVMTELRNAGHEASTRDHTEHENAYPSVALSFTPHSDLALASALIIRYDPRHGVVVQADVKPAPTARSAVPAAVVDRLGTIGVDALSAEWVETKTLNFVQAVLKAN